MCMGPTARSARFTSLPWASMPDRTALPLRCRRCGVIGPDGGLRAVRPMRPALMRRCSLRRWIWSRRWRICAGLLPDDVILTNGAGNFTVWPNKFFKFGPKARLLAPQSGAMGYGVPAAIAAKVAHPDRTVVCFAGDGDFQMNCQELGTAMQAGAQPIILIVNNGIYGTIRAHQERNYPARVSGTTMVNPDFVALARAYGYHAERVALTAEFPAAFERALNSKTGAVLDLDISPEAITPRQTLSQMRAQAQAAKDKA